MLHDGIGPVIRKPDIVFARAAVVGMSLQFYFRTWVGRHERRYLFQLAGVSSPEIGLVEIELYEQFQA